jgi:sialidase-1
MSLRPMIFLTVASCSFLFLSNLMAARITAQETPNTIANSKVFKKVVRKNGAEGVHTYRIPGLATTTKGTLIAVFDARHKSSADLPGDIDVGMMRSTDQGNTWSQMERIIDFDASEPNSKGNGVGDPAILVDKKTGTIFVAALWSQGARAWHGSGPGLTPAETGQFVIVKSSDDGLTWSKPISVTSQFKHPAWRLCFNGPGNGIQLKDGTLIFPAQFKDADAVPHSCFVASQDGGSNWAISPAAIPSAIPTSESAIVQLRDDSLLLSMRNESKAGVRAWAQWTWHDDVMNGKWSEPRYKLPDPTCMASLIKHPTDALLFSNPNHEKRRVALTVRVSYDSGQSWNNGLLLEPAGAMYSSLTVLADGRIGILYESDEADGLVFARFALEDVDRGE